MIKHLVLLLSLAMLTSCKTAHISEPKFKVGFHQNTETYFLAELLAVPYRKTNTQWETYKINTCKAYQPMVAMALEQFQNPKTEAFAKHTAEFSDALVGYGYGNDIMMPILLQIPEFSTGKAPEDFEMMELQLTDEQKAALKLKISAYLQTLYQFYKEEEVGKFFETHSGFYDGAIEELRKLIPPNFTDAMERYYGDTRKQYVALVSPMEIWPIEENEARGISATVTRDGKQTVYEVMSPYVEVPVNATHTYDHYGFDFERTATFLTVHEFSHSFVNAPLERYRERIEQSSYLFTDDLKEKMASKGVGNW